MTSKEAQETILEYAKDDKAPEALQRGAILALSKQPDASKELVPYLTDKRYPIKTAAQTTLVAMGLPGLPALLEGLESEPSEESLASRALVAEAVAAAVRSLDADRQAMLLMKFQGLSNAEIAASLGRSEGAVKSLYHRTLADLRELLDGQNGTAPAVPGNGAKHHDDE